MALRVGHEKLTARRGGCRKVSWEEGVLADDPLVRGEPRPLDRPRRLADRPAPAARRGYSFGMRVLVTGGGGFLGSHLVERLEADGHDVVVRAAPSTTSRDMRDAARLFDDAGPSSSSISRRKSAASAPTAPTPGATGTRT